MDRLYSKEFGQKRCEEEIIIRAVMYYCAENVFIASIRDCNRKEGEIDSRLVVVRLKPPTSATEQCTDLDDGMTTDGDQHHGINHRRPKVRPRYRVIRTSRQARQRRVPLDWVAGSILKSKLSDRIVPVGSCILSIKRTAERFRSFPPTNWLIMPEYRI